MRFDRVLDISECHLQPEPSNSIRNFVREHARQHGMSFYDVREHQGFLRTLLIRTTTTGECMVLLAVGHEDSGGPRTAAGRTARCLPATHQPCCGR